MRPKPPPTTTPEPGSLSPAGQAVWRWLSEHDGRISISTICAASGLHRATVSRVLSDLTRRGVIDSARQLKGVVPTSLELDDLFSNLPEALAAADADDDLFSNLPEPLKPKKAKAAKARPKTSPRRLATFQTVALRFIKFKEHFQHIVFTQATRKMAFAQAEMMVDKHGSLIVMSFLDWMEREKAGELENADMLAYLNTRLQDFAYFAHRVQSDDRTMLDEAAKRRVRPDYSERERVFTTSWGAADYAEATMRYQTYLALRVPAQFQAEVRAAVAKKFKPRVDDLEIFIAEQLLVLVGGDEARLPEVAKKILGLRVRPNLSALHEYGGEA